jgi:hypothetical protein
MQPVTGQNNQLRFSLFSAGVPDAPAGAENDGLFEQAGSYFTK